MAALAYIITVVLCWRSPLLSQLEKTKVRCCVCNVRDGRVVTSSGTSHIHQPDTFLEQPMDTQLFLSESPWWCKIDIKQIFLSSRVDQCENICILCKYLNVVNNIIHATTRTKLIRLMQPQKLVWIGNCLHTKFVREVNYPTLIIMSRTQEAALPGLISCAKTQVFSNTPHPHSFHTVEGRNAPIIKSFYAIHKTLTKNRGWSTITVFRWEFVMCTLIQWTFESAPWSLWQGRETWTLWHWLSVEHDNDISRRDCGQRQDGHQRSWGSKDWAWDNSGWDQGLLGHCGAGGGGVRGVPHPGEVRADAAQPGHDHTWLGGGAPHGVLGHAPAECWGREAKVEITGLEEKIMLKIVIVYEECSIAQAFSISQAQAPQL